MFLHANVVQSQDSAASYIQPSINGYTKINVICMMLSVFFTSCIGWQDLRCTTQGLLLSQGAEEFPQRLNSKKQGDVKINTAGYHKVILTSIMKDEMFRVVV